MLPLEEHTIVVTRPREQSFELKNELEKFGASVVLFPTIEIAPVEDYTDLNLAIRHLAEYDWLVFTSANAVEYFLQRLELCGVEVVEVDYLRVCAVGEATAERLRLSQIHFDVLPAESNAEAVFAEINEYVAGEFADLRFLLPRSSIGRQFLAAKLRENGAFVTDVPAYQTIIPLKPEIGKIKALLQSGAVDCLTFTSPSTFNNFVRILEKEDLPALLSGVKIAAIGATTADAVRQHSFPVDIISNEQTAASFAQTIADFYISS